jgi:hypothetical protein
LSALDIYDLIFLLALGVLTTWATVTPRKWVRFLVAAFLFATIIFCDLEYGPAARHVMDRHHDQSIEFHKRFMEGVIEMLGAIRIYRLYIIVAVIGLFSISISRCGKDQDNDPSKEG